MNDSEDNVNIANENSSKDGSANDLETIDYLRGVKSSTCLLLPTTPSPTHLDFKHPLSEEMNEGPFLTLNDDPNLVNLQNSGDSSSSVDSSSVVQDLVSAQLINNISMLEYQTLSKNGDLSMSQVEDCKNGNLNVNNRKLPDFVKWNWGLIRTILLWVVLSGLIACLGAIIGMVVTIPKKCNPDLPWYQGKVFYELFPASFKDSNNDGTGDIKGLIKKLDYIESLGASAIRLNSIFEAQEYPEHYYNTTSLLIMDRSLGVLKDLQDLITAVHKRNMSLILDLPVLSMATNTASMNHTQTLLTTNDSLKSTSDATSAAIAFWAKVQKVDGFYLKNLEKFVDDNLFASSLRKWKQTIGYDKIFIASEKALQKASGVNLNVLLSRIDLIDIHLDLQDGIAGLKKRIDDVLLGTLWHKPHYPWVHWNIGSIHSERISTKHINNTLVLTALEFVLPGTVSIFYGDEIGLGGLPLNEIEEDFHEHKYVHNLVPMIFSDQVKGETNKGILPWNSKSVLEPKYHYLEILKKLAEVKLTTPTLYLRAIFKEDNVVRNAEVRKTDEDLIVIERWYPRRNTCVFVGNLGSQSITTDLSAMFYGGTVVAGTNTSLIGQTIYFDEVTFPPNSAIILKLEK